MNISDKASENRSNEALAILISSTKSRKRPISLIEVSKWLRIAVNLLGGYKQVADRIGLSTKMLRQFSMVNSLHPKTQAFFRRREIDSVDAVVHLLQFPIKDQITIAKLLANKKIDTMDLRAILQSRKSSPSIPIKYIYHKIIKSKTIKRYIVEFVIPSGYNRNTLMGVFKRHISKINIIKLDINGRLGRLLLKKDGKLELQKTAKQLKTRFHTVIPAILSRDY